MYERARQQAPTCTCQASRATSPEHSTVVNMHGDSFRRDDHGRVTYYRFRHSDVAYSITYASDGSVAVIDSSNGWSWTRHQSHGWMVRNYFERWTVNSRDCFDVTVDEMGFRATGEQVDRMSLPER